MVDKLLTINLRNYLVKQPVRRRHSRLSRYVRGRISHYMKVDEENVRITGDLNILMTKKHVKSMLPLKLNVRIENGIATASPFAQPKAAPAAATAAPAKKEAAKTTTAAPKTEKKATEPRTAAKVDAKKEAKPAAATK